MAPSPAPTRLAVLLTALHWVSAAWLKPAGVRRERCGVPGGGTSSADYPAPGWWRRSTGDGRSARSQRCPPRDLSGGIAMRSQCVWATSGKREGTGGSLCRTRPPEWAERRLLIPTS